MKRSIGEIVKERRLALGLTQQQLCAMLNNYDAGNLSRFEKGSQRIVEDRLDEIAEALGTTTWELFRQRDQLPDGSAVPIAANAALRVRYAERWPFPVAVERFDSLPDIDKVRCESYLQATIDAWEARNRGIK